MGLVVKCRPAGTGILWGLYSGDRLESRLRPDGIEAYCYCTGLILFMSCPRFRRSLLYSRSVMRGRALCSKSSLLVTS